MKYILASILLLFLSFASSANTKGVANVVKMKGEITFENPVTGESGKLVEGMWLGEKSIIKSEAKSFARVVFIDKSTMTIGPGSEVEIKQFPKQEAGVINLLKGKIRSEVTKNYLEMKDKDSSKLYITTKTAAMGVRGTDFQVTYNPMNNTTGLVTYSGAVAMNRFRENVNFNNDRAVNTRELESIVRAPESVLVVKGQFSRASEQDDKPLAPVKVAPSQLYQLKKDQSLEREMGEKNSERSLIPPGVNSKEIVNTASGLEDSVKKAIILEGGPIPSSTAPTAIPPQPVMVMINEQMKTDIVLANGGILPPPPLKPIAFLPPPPPPNLSADELLKAVNEIKPEAPSIGNVKIIINLQ